MLYFQNRLPILRTLVSSSVRLKDQDKSLSVSFLENSFLNSYIFVASPCLRCIEVYWRCRRTAQRNYIGQQSKGLSDWWWSSKSRDGEVARTGHYCPGVKWDTRERMFFWWEWWLSEMKAKARFVSSNFNQTSSFFLVFSAQYPAYLIVWLHANSKHALQLVSLEPIRNQTYTMCVFVFNKWGKISINRCGQACGQGSAGNGETSSQAAPCFDNRVQPGTTSWA